MPVTEKDGGPVGPVGRLGQKQCIQLVPKFHLGTRGIIIAALRRVARVRVRRETVEPVLRHGSIPCCSAFTLGLHVERIPPSGAGRVHIVAGRQPRPLA